MTVAELIERLSDLRKDLPVYIRGYEGGVEDLTHVHVSHFERDYNDPAETWVGRHQERYSGGPINGVQLIGEQRT